MHKDYYATLGVSKQASKEDIKKAFRTLAAKYHPDKTGGDEKRFKEINEAYQVLSDDKKRAEYDSYGHVFSGGVPPGGGFGGENPFGAFWEDANGFDLGEMFSEFFGGGGFGSGRAKRGRDISIDLEISFEESIFGVERKILLTKSVICDTCGGTGAKKEAGFITCSKCNGQGKVRETKNSILGSFTSIRECGECGGVGKIPHEKCAVCRGRKILQKQEELPIKIPAGIGDGEVIRMEGGGEAVARGVAGDLYVKIHVGKHPLFRREGNNIVTTLDIKLSDALLGNEYAIKTLDGVIKLKIPSAISFGEILRVKGKGVPYPDRRGRGDLLIKINVKLPANLSRKARELVEKLKEEGV